jgi:hypothetical protein
VYNSPESLLTIKGQRRLPPLPQRPRASSRTRQQLPPAPYPHAHTHAPQGRNGLPHPTPCRLPLARVPQPPRNPAPAPQPPRFCCTTARYVRIPSAHAHLRDRSHTASKTPLAPLPQTLEHIISLFVSNGGGGGEEEAGESRALFVGKIPVGGA